MHIHPGDIALACNTFSRSKKLFPKMKLEDGSGVVLRPGFMVLSMHWEIHSYFELTPGQNADITMTRPLIENCIPSALIADKAYDCDDFIRYLWSSPGTTGFMGIL